VKFLAFFDFLYRKSGCPLLSRRLFPGFMIFLVVSYYTIMMQNICLFYGAELSGYNLKPDLTWHYQKTKGGHAYAD